MEKLDITSLHNAVSSLQKALKEYDKDTSNEFVRDACIQRFEYCYDLSCKFITRYLSMTESDTLSVESMDFPDKIRTAYSRGIIENDWEEWVGYRDNYNITSRSYDAQKMQDIVREIPTFYDEAMFLLKELAQRNEA